MIFPIVIGLTILSIFFLFIINKKNKVLSDYYLIAIILFFVGILGSHILMETWPSIVVYLIVLFFNTYYFPVLVIYGLILLDGKNKLNKNWLWIFCYPIIYNVFLVLDILVFNDYSSFADMQSLFDRPTKYQLFFYITQYIYVIVLLVWLAKKLNAYTAKIKNVHSSIEHINLNWFRYFILSFLGLSSSGFVVFLCFSFGIIDNIEIPFGIEYIIFILLLFYLCYNGIRQYTIADMNHKQLGSQTKSQPIEKYQSSNLDNESIDFHFQEITQLFDEEKVFLEPQLKIDDVASKLNISVHKISQVINSRSNKNFYDFVNRYRVEYFKKLLSDPNHRKFTILSLGIESGFNSKASMNRVFKNYEGQSPKEFQKSQHNFNS
ncbi:helix-turn-helix domain-containing protein [Flagellimonas nanhaiensis]|uniref:Helix-turn-helix domain-containing protein n=1 Tax=Flagellimonas nanhaiensis TaxID=2292706 RepID=A0A371JNA6_9FLAO|nr:helix-turn-helix domain-containing protein [Allomuricauda nanhaiensis]RDY58721.1 helix-turn-helix domain-containing protein [Allomuricauda nanhaiensis]